MNFAFHMNKCRFGHIWWALVSVGIGIPRNVIILITITLLMSNYIILEVFFRELICMVQKPFVYLSLVSYFRRNIEIC